jgi:hypothetical protein
MTAPTLDDNVGTHGDDVAAQLARIASRLDDVVAVQAAERAERQRWADLVHELTPVAQAAMSLASDELEDLTRDVTVDDAVRFARTLARTLPQLEVLLTQVAAAQDLLGEVTSLTGAGMGALSDALGDAERRGYFAAARGGGAVLDRVAAVLAAPPPTQPPSALALARRLRDPRVRAGLARTLDLLTALGAVPSTGSPTPIAKKG